MQKAFAPQRLDVTAFASQQGHLSGDLHGAAALQMFARLAEDAAGLPPTAADQTRVQWQASGDLRAGPGTTRQPWLHLAVASCLVQACQRCLQPVVVDVDFERDYRFVADEATAAREDADAQEDLLVVSRQFDMLALLEDELLMALPLVALHDSCPVELPTSAATDDFASEGAADGADTPGVKPNPFSALARLKIPPG